MTETETFYIADYQIDMSRSVIRKGENATQIEPKVLKVLLLLAKRPNQVITHKEIMDDVWQGTEVVPNALQRCIAILRKALNDDAKSPTIIATHKKIGYSLIAQVKWGLDESEKRGEKEEPHAIEKIELPAKAITADAPAHSILSLIITGMLFVLGVIALLVVAPFGQAPQEPLQQKQFPQKSTTSIPVQLNQIKVLTHTDAHESHAIYSPDAQHIVFNRYAGSCKNHLWTRNMKNGQEHQLTASPAQYGEVSFTNDGRELVFAANKQCPLDQERVDFEERQSTETCWHLATLDFSQALTTPQTPNYRHQCQAEKLKTPKALSNHQYVFLQSKTGENQLMHYNDLTKEISHFYRPDLQDIYHFDYDPYNKRFAVFGRDHAYKNILTLLNTSGQVLHRNRIEQQHDAQHTQDIKGNFEPLGSYLLTIIQSQLYKLDLDGKLTQIDTPTSDLVSVVKHPLNHSLLAVQGTKDIDIANINIADVRNDEQSSQQDSNDLNSINAPYPSLARSSAQEQIARYQPSGDQIAFISNQSGINQLWLWDKGIAKQLSFDASATGIKNYSWSPDGTHLAWAFGDSIAIADLTGKMTLIPAEKSIDAVVSWFSENELLVLLHDPYPGGLYTLALNKSDRQKLQLTALGINHVEAAWVTQIQNQLEKQVIYKTADAGVFIRALENKKRDKGQRIKLNSMAVTVAGGFIYSVDKSSLMLNQYNVEGKLLKPIMQMKNNAWQVTDIKFEKINEAKRRNDKLLISQFIAVNQEVVVLH